MNPSNCPPTSLRARRIASRVKRGPTPPRRRFPWLPGVAAVAAAAVAAAAAALGAAADAPAPCAAAVATPVTAAAPVRTHKGVAPLEMSWRLERAPRVGEPVTVVLDFAALAGLEGELLLKAEEGLRLNGPDRLTLPRRVAGEHWTVRVAVTPEVHASRYLHVVAATRGEAGERRMRGFAVPFDLPGTVSRKAEGEWRTDAPGGAVISLPAREEIRPAP